MFWTVTQNLLRGFGTTVLLFFVTLVCALPLGLLLAFCTMSRHKALAYPFKGIVWVVRGTPLMMQVLIIFYVPGLLFGVKPLERFTAVSVAFIVNYACYFSEIYRSGLQSVPRGQYEAGQALGMTRADIFFRVILFQVVRRITPPMGNEIITLVKDTSIARVIMVQEILFVAFSDYVAKGILWPLFYTGVFYLVFVGVLTLLFGFLEKKMSYYKM